MFQTTNQMNLPSFYHHFTIYNRLLATEKSGPSGRTTSFLDHVLGESQESEWKSGNKITPRPNKTTIGNWSNWSYPIIMWSYPQNTVIWSYPIIMCYWIIG
jgi:hypothetical protein